MEEVDELESLKGAERKPNRDFNETAELMHPSREQSLAAGKARDSFPKRPSGIDTQLDDPSPRDLDTPIKKDLKGRTPSGRTPSNRQALQDRINSRRNKKEDNNPNTPTGDKTDDFTERNNRRKELLKMRHKARESAEADDADDQDEDSVVKGRPKDSAAPVEEPQQHALVTVMLPPHIYPLEILPKRRSSEAAVHPLLVVPAPHPHPSKVVTDCFASLTRCCSGAEYYPHYEELEWGEEEEAAGAVLTSTMRTQDPIVNGRSGAGEKPYSETDMLLSNAEARDGGQEGVLSSLDKYASPLDTEMSAQYQECEGLFVGRRPLLASQLMDGEEVGLEIASMVAKDLYLSRITQRILRDICGSEVLSKKRREWVQLNGPPVDKEERRLYEGSMRLLKVVNTLHGRGPVLRVFEDPVDEAAYEPIVDNHGYDDREEKEVRKPKSRDMHEMQFGATSTKKDMLGHIPVWSGQRASRRGRRGILRVHVQTICITKFALMCEEERKFIDLKRIYASYRVLFEQQATGYLVYRLRSLLMELSRITSQEVAILSDETAAEAKAILADVLETLPSLAELRSGLASLTDSLYTSWVQLKEIRKRQRFVSTRAVLVGRPLYFMDELGNALPSKFSRSPSGEEADGGKTDDSDGRGFFQHLEAEVAHWSSMQERLSDLPEMVENLCYRLRDHSESKFKPISKTVAEETAEAAAEESNSYGPDFMAAVSAVTKQSVKDLQGQFLPLMVYRLTNLGHISNDPQGDHSKLQASTEDVKDIIHQLDPVEAKRRQDVCGLSIKLVLKVNGRVMTSTAPAPLQWPSYSASILRSYEFRVFKHLASVTFDVYLCRAGILGGTDTLVGTVPVPLPYLAGDEVTAQNMAPVAGWSSFTSAFPTVVKRSGQTLPDRIEGALLCGSEYEVFSENVKPSRLDGIKTNQVSRFSQPSSKSGKSVVLGSNQDFTRERDFHKLLPDMDALDPNDPQNEHLIRLKKQLKNGNQATRDSFVLIGGKGAAANFSENGNSYANFLKTKVPDRIRLLMMRESRPYLFAEPIPLSEAIIQTSEFYRSLLADGMAEGAPPGALKADLTKTADGPLEPIDEADEDGGAEYGEGIGVPVSKITSFLQRVRDSHTAVSRQSKQKKIATNSVINEPIQINPAEFSFANLFKFAELFEPRRALKPKPTARKPVTTILSSCDLLIQVVGGKNIPLRNSDLGSAMPTRASTAPRQMKQQSFDTEGGDFDENSSMLSDYDPAMGRAAIAGMARPMQSFGGAATRQSSMPTDLLDKKKLQDKQRARTFVEVRFQDDSVCTTSIEGGAPNWKQSLSLGIYPPHGDFSPQSLEMLHENIYFTLFDEIIADDSQRGGYLEGESTERVEKRYLGSFAIPFATVFNHSRVDGVFRLDVPAFNLGYHSPYEKKTADARDLNPPQEETNYGNAPSVIDSFFGPPGRPTANADTSHAAWDLRVDAATEAEFDYFASGSSATFLKVLITLDPLLSPIVVPGLELSPTTICPVDRFLVSHAHSWLTQLKSKSVTADREYNIFGCNSDGYKVFSCRYLTPQEPPMDIVSRRGCLHLTSMIPFMPDAQAFIGAYDLWCTSKQMWDMGAGDEEEHAITLYNYFTFISCRNGPPSSRSYGEYPAKEVVAKEENFLASGRAIPEGDSIYILCRQPEAGAAANPHSAKNFILINPCTGFVYSTADRNCPMIEITTLSTPYNIWANIQATVRPCEMSFDVLDPRCWKPFFCSAFPYPKGGLSTMQETVQFIPTSAAACVQIERELKGAIKTKFRRWRSKRARSAALFHPDACSVVADHLYLLEEWKMTGAIPSLGQTAADGGHAPVYTSQKSKFGTRTGGRHGSSDGDHVLSLVQAEIRSKLKNVLRKKKFYGYPINIPFTDVNIVTEKVKAMGFHETRHPNVQFVLAVKAFPLVNNLVSLWIFLGTLEEDP